jgi:hypothetical protein
MLPMSESLGSVASTFRYLGSFVVVLAVVVSLVGCRQKSGPIAQEQVNLAWLGQMYAKYASQNNGAPPKTIDDFQKFVEQKTNAERLANLKVASANELFISPRDSKPFTMVVYDKLPTMKAGEQPPVVLYESEGKSGRRAIALLGGVTRTVDEAEVQKMVPPSVKRSR